MPRHTPLITAALTCTLLLTGCAGNTTSSTTADSKNVARIKIPEKVKADTTITIGAPETQVALRLSGQIKKLPFKVEWANISGGPQAPRHSARMRWISARSRTSRRSTRTGPASAQDRRLEVPPGSAQPRHLPARHRARRRASAPWPTCAARRSPTARGRPRARWCCGCCARRD